MYIHDVLCIVTSIWWFLLSSCGDKKHPSQVRADVAATRPLGFDMIRC